MQVTIEPIAASCYLYRYGLDCVEGNWGTFVELLDKTMDDEVAVIAFDTFNEALSCQKRPIIKQYNELSFKMNEKIDVKEIKNKDIYLFGLYIKEMGIYKWIAFPKIKTACWEYLLMDILRESENKASKSL